METIKERAEKAFPKICPADHKAFCKQVGYIKGATDQKKIDVDKALKVYADLLSANGYDLGSINAELARMKQAMEK